MELMRKSTNTLSPVYAEKKVKGKVPQNFVQTERQKTASNGGRIYGNTCKAGNRNRIQCKIHDLNIGPINDRGQTCLVLINKKGERKRQTERARGSGLVAVVRMRGKYFRNTSPLCQ